MAGFCLSYRYLRWTNTLVSDLAPSLPAGFERHMLDTPSGQLELLYAAPAPSTLSNPAPMFFVHGGMDSAHVWLEYMQYLSQRGIPCYAISMRGHGRSWAPGYLRMAFFTSRAMLENDVVAGIRFAERREGQQVVLVGHSSGGGISQALLNQGKVQVKALVLAAAVPGFGSTNVYLDWMKMDRWSSIRGIFHLWHPNTMLSHPALVQRAFFSTKVTQSFVENFMQHAAPYEAFGWPISMLRQFVQPLAVLQHIRGWDDKDKKGRARVLVLAGELDAIIRTYNCRKLAAFYHVGEHGQTAVKYEEVSGVAHHLQNDVGWEAGAQKLIEFYEQL
ncbi:Alpha/Beta hydrolase protein [Auriculariales sp. MPI-PUGE-AT-0066]|nr:Alpha/Beta hydrolase protein [Auriculariales sp. MPI-PUGE-AT-0066]